MTGTYTRQTHKMRSVILPPSLQHGQVSGIHMSFPELSKTRENHGMETSDNLLLSVHRSTSHWVGCRSDRHLYILVRSVQSEGGLLVSTYSFNQFSVFRTGSDLVELTKRVMLVKPEIVIILQQHLPVVQCGRSGRKR